MTTVNVPVAALTLTAYAPTVYVLGKTTGSVGYIPLRAYADGASQSVDPSADLQNLRALLPSQRQQVENPDGTMKPDWYRFIDYLVNVYLGGPSSTTVVDIKASLEASLVTQALQAQSVALIAAQSQTNAEALAAVVQVVQNNALTGADQIPRVSQSYLEP